MIWEVFQMHIAQRSMCSHYAEITCHSSSSGTPDLCWDMSSCLHVFHLAENDGADAGEGLWSQESGQLRKAALSLGAGGVCRLVWWAAPGNPGQTVPARCAWEGRGPPKSRGSSSQQTRVVLGSSVALQQHQEPLWNCSNTARTAHVSRDSSCSF